MTIMDYSEEKCELLWRFNIFRRYYPTVAIPLHDVLATEDETCLRRRYSLAVAEAKVIEDRKELVVFLGWITNLYNNVIYDDVQVDRVFREIALLSTSITADDIDSICRRHLDSLDMYASSYDLIRLTIDAYRGKDLKRGRIDIIKQIGGVTDPDDINECFVRMASFDPGNTRLNTIKLV